MALTLRKAVREKLKARIGMCGASGSGKTYSSLRLAYGLCGSWDKIAVIDTENRRSEHYVGTNQNGVEIGEFNTVTLDPPFSPKRYMEAISVCEQAGMEVIVIDSLSHAWAGTGGMLEIKDNLGAGFDAWRKLSPIHNDLIDKLLRCKAHLITCLRAKTEYVVEKDERGKSVPRKIGTKPEFRDGLEFEMSLFLDISPEHACCASKDDSGIFGLSPFMATEESGRMFREWLDTGKEPESRSPARTVERPVNADFSSSKENGEFSDGSIFTTPAQQRYLHVTGSRAGLSKEGFSAWLKAIHGFDSTKQLWQSQVADICKEIEGLTSQEIADFNDLGSARKLDAKAESEAGL